MQIDHSIERVRKQREQLDARLRDLESRKRTCDRKNETRKKILAGALVLEMMEKDLDLKKKFNEHVARYLQRDIDRALFDLPALPLAEPKQAVVARQADHKSVPQKQVV